MIYRRFTIQTIFRVILILVNVSVLASIFGDDRLFFNQIILGVILAVQIWELIRFVNATNRELTKFFEAIRQSDFTINFTKDYLGSSFSGLFENMSSILNTYKKVKIEKEAQFHLLGQIINHVPAGIIAIAEMDSIILLNESAKKILQIPEIKSWKGLQAKAQKFTEFISDLSASGRFLVEIEIGSSVKTLSLDLSRFTLLEEEYELITFSDIKSEIEQKEIEAWHRLIRILTHEIMNSVTPISSLTETMQMMLQTESKPKQASELTDQTINDLSFSLKTIQKRSDGLLNFVEDYRRLTKVPKPQLENIVVKDLLENVIQLMSAELKGKNITIKINAEAGFTILMDRNLVEQVLINLVKNGMEALDGIEKPELILNAYAARDQDTIEISDNGIGIDPEEMNDIWVPFYTTKDSGSGIGLSLSKQVMKLHHGNITLSSEPGCTKFKLSFIKKPL